jgi:glycosyltransferase involved in cell wall biosynthesis
VKYVAVSEDRRAQLADLLNVASDTIQVITPGVDIYAFLEIGDLVQKLMEKLGLLEADPLLLLPARITRRKNIEFAILVTSALSMQKPAAHLIVTGPPGPHNPNNVTYLAELKGISEQLGVADRVHFLYEHGEGSNPLNLPDQSIAQLYRLVDALIFPSKREGFGIPVLEAGLARLPVFAADIPPVRESGGEHTYLFPLHASPKQVADQIIFELMGDHQYLLRRRVLRQFSWQAVVTEQIIPLIEPYL